MLLTGPLSITLIVFKYKSPARVCPEVINTSKAVHQIFFIFEKERKNHIGNIYYDDAGLELPITADISKLQYHTHSESALHKSSVTIGNFVKEL